MSDETNEKGDRPRDFIRQIIDADLASGKHTQPVTRFPPEPNGYLHIGHAKSICLNFGIADEYGGPCHLRFDDTNPTTENPEFVESIQRDISWLGFDWGEHLYHVSSYFERLYGFATELIEKGLAYVDSQSVDEIREKRGTIESPGVPSRDRDRSVEENLDLFRRMRGGEFPDGALVLRAKIDMAAANMLMRDPILYRIRHAHHYRTGDAWPIYPMYDFAHCLSDAIEGITHSLCTLEFENNREIYDWLVARVSVPAVPRQYEFARLNINFTVLSKRKLRALVEEGHVAGWDDPRMPTLSGLRRRGVTPEAIRTFAERVGVAKNHNVIDLALLEHTIRDDLNTRAPRAMGVLRPLELVIENYSDALEEHFDADHWPHDVPKDGTRPLPFSRTLWIERDDFAIDPPPGFYRLSPGEEVRLRWAYVVRCTGFERDDDGNVIRVRCTYDPDTHGGQTTDGRRVKGTIHWVSKQHAVDAEVHLYDRLFLTESPDAGDGDFREHLNPDSLEIIPNAKLEASLAEAGPGDRFQLERLGYFMFDQTSCSGDSDAEDSNNQHRRLNRVVTLRDTWAKQSSTSPAPRVEAAAARTAEKEAFKAAQRAQATETSLPVLEGDAAARANALIDLGVGDSEARVLATDDALRRRFDAARDADGAVAPRSLASWAVNELRGLVGERPLDDVAVDGAGLAALVAEVDGDRVTAAAAKDVLAEMVEKGGDPIAIIQRRGLAKISDDDALTPLVEAVIAAHPSEAAAYRDGKKALLGFFVGQVMKQSGGNADPKRTRALIVQNLEG